MDHEFFSDNLTEGKVGWDWMSVQLDDGADLMLFGIRDARRAATALTPSAPSWMPGGGVRDPIEPGEA